MSVDQGVEHSAGASFSFNPMYFDPENIIKLAIEGGCNAVVSAMGGLAMAARKYAYKIPFIAKINHNELLTYPNNFDQIMFGSVRDAWNLGAVAVGATIYSGHRNLSGKLPQFPRHLKKCIAWVWLLFYGAISVIAVLKKIKLIMLHEQTLPARKIILA